MTYPEAILLAILQGVTEFLPVSSSGHLVLAQNLLGQLGEGDFLYDVMLHLATMVAILAYLRHDLWTIWLGLTGRATRSDSVFAGRERQVVVYMFLASLPTAVIGFVLQRYALSLLMRPDIVGGMLVMTGGLLWLCRARQPHRCINQMGLVDALTIGVIQGIAVTPGISRSGSTIAGGIVLGLDRELAARFSLLISIPAILGAVILESTKAINQTQLALGPCLTGMAIATIVGYLSIGLILRLVRQNHFYLFAWYLWPLGLGTVLLTSLG